VTEWVTGVDLVKSQLEIADGRAVPRDLSEPRGHAVECRVCAEDASRGYAPSPGPVLALAEPVGPGIRVDSSLRAGWRVPAAYDPLLAKVSAWDRPRAEAMARLARALDGYVILGCGTNIEFLRDVIQHAAFCRGETPTDFLQPHFSEWQPSPPALALA